MKISAPKQTAATAATHSPFFSKGGQQDFFSNLSGRQPFFSNNSDGIQAKLSVGQPNDKYEREADSVADKVVQRLSGNINTAATEKNGIQRKPANPVTPLLQTKCKQCEEEEEQEKEKENRPEKLQRKPIFESSAEMPDEEKVQRKCDACEKEEELQKKPISGSSSPSSGIESTLGRTKRSGSPLPLSTRNEMESSFSSDFSGVRIHNDSTARQMNKDLNAQAFTHGSDIYFNEGKFDTTSKGGQHLLAHELTHVLQQNGNFSSNSQLPDVQKDDIIEVELVGPVLSYTVPNSNKRITVGDAVGSRILTGIELGFGGKVTLRWYNFAYNISQTGDVQNWLFLQSAKLFFPQQEAFENLSNQLSPAEWERLPQDPLPKLLEMHELKSITIPDTVLLSSYKGMIYVEAKAALNKNEAKLDELLNAGDRIKQIQDYADGLKEASKVRDALEKKKKTTEREIKPRIDEIEHRLTQAHSLTFGFAGNFQNMNPYQRMQLLKEEEKIREPVHRIEQALAFWYQSFELLSRFKTDEITSTNVETKLRKIKSNIVSTRPDLDRAMMDKGPLDLMELIPIREQIGGRLGKRATATITAEDKRRGRNAIIGGALMFVGGILLLFVPGGAFIDLAIGVAMAAKSIRDAAAFGHAANTGLHVDDGLMTQAQARMAEFTAVISTVFAVIGVAAASFRVLRIGAAYSRISKAAPELSVGSRMSLSRLIAKNPGLLRTFRRSTQELEQELARLKIKLTYEEIQGLRAAMFQFHKIPVVSTSRESLDSFLETVWNSRGKILSDAGNPLKKGNPVYNMYSAAAEANPLNLSNKEYLDEIQKIIASRPAGTLSNIQGEAARGFHRFLRPGLTDKQLYELAKANKIAERIYLNTNANRATEVMGFVVKEIVDDPGRFPGVAMAKLTGPAGVSGRADAIVIYCESQEAANLVLQRIRDYHRLNPGYFQRSVPAMTKQVMEGVGLASEPLGVAGGASFGSTRTDVILKVLKDVEARGGNRQEFMKEIYDTLRQSGFNPDAPHMNLPATGAASGTIQPKLESGKANLNNQDTNGEVQTKLAAVKGSGKPLLDATRTDMESGFGTDFSGVRVHDDSSAAEMSENLSAQAFTQGNDIYFNSGKYDVNSKSGKHLLAHELTHTIQQNQSATKPASDQISKQPIDNSFVGEKVQRQEIIVEEVKAKRNTVAIEYSPPWDIFYDVQWHYNASLVFQHDFRMVFYVDEERRKLLKSAEIAAVSADILQTGMGIKFKGGGVELARKIYQIIEDYKLDGAIFALGIESSFIRDICEDPGAYDTFYAALKANKYNAGENYLIAAGDIGGTMSGKNAGKGSTKGVGAGWANQQKKDLEKLIADAKKTRKDPGKLPDNIALWQKEETGQWYLNIWLTYDKQGKKKTAQAIKLNEGETAEELLERVKAAGQQAATKEADREMSEEAKLAPAWALDLTRKLKRYFDEQRQKTKAQDIPDGLELGMSLKQGEPGNPSLSIQIWVERGKVQKERNRGTVPVVAGATVEQLVPYIRHMTTVLRQYENVPLGENPPPPEGMEPTLKDPSNLQLSPFPAELMAIDMREDHISVTGGRNTFLMNLDFEAVYGNSGSMTDLTIASKLYNQYIHFYWSIYKVPDELKPTPLKPEKETPGEPAKEPAKEATEEPVPVQTWPKRWTWLYEMYNTGKDKPEEKIKQIAQLEGPVSKTNGSEMRRSLKLPPGPGIYIVQCMTASAAIGDYKLKRSPSYAFYPFMTKPIKEMGEESVSQRGSTMDAITAEIKAIEELLAGGGLDESQVNLLKERQTWKTQELERLKLKESQTASENAASEIAYATKLISQLKELESILPGYMERAQAEGVKPSDLLKARPELLGLYWNVISDGKSIKGYRVELEAQLDELKGMQKRSAEFSSEFDPSSPYQYNPEAAFVSEVTGHIYPLVLMVGQSPVPKPTPFIPSMVSYTVADITSSQTQEAYQGYGKGTGPSAHKSAIDDAFGKFGDDATYGEGIIAVRFSGGESRKADPNFPGSKIIYYPSEEGIFEKVMWALGIIAAVAGAAALMATGVGAPAAAGLLGAVAAAAGAVTAIHNISERSKKHKLEWDAELALDVISIISVIPLAAGARLATLPKTASNFRSIVIAGKFLQIYGYAEMGATLVLVPLKLAQDIQRIEQDDSLSPDQKRAMIREAKLGAVQAGLMMLGGAIASHAAGSHGSKSGYYDKDPASFDQQVKLLELEGFGEYKSLEDRGMLDGTGKWTDKALDIVGPTAPQTEPGIPKTPVDTTVEPRPSTPKPKTEPTVTEGPAVKPPREDIPPTEPKRPVQEPSIPDEMPGKTPAETKPPASTDETPGTTKEKPGEEPKPAETKPPSTPDETPATKPADATPDTPEAIQDRKIKEAEVKVKERQVEKTQYELEAKKANDEVKKAEDELAKASKGDKKEARRKLKEAKANKKFADEMLDMAKQDVAVAKSEASQQRQVKLAAEAEATRQFEDPVRKALQNKRQEEGRLNKQYQNKAKERDRLRKEIDGMVGSKMDDATVKKFQEKNDQLAKTKAEIEGLGKKLDAVRSEIGARSKELSGLQALTLGKIEKLQSEIREGRGITQTDYDRLRGKTPSGAIKRKYKNAKMDSVYPDLAIVGTPEPDHIVSMNEITQMEGFNRLTEKQKVEVLNTPENFMPLDKRVNSSKGDRSFSQWDGHPEFGEIDPGHRKTLLDTEAKARTAIETAISKRDPLKK